MVLYEATTGDLYPERNAARDAPWWEPRRRVIGSIEELALYLGCRVSDVVLRRDGSWTSGVPESGTYRIGERSDGSRLRPSVG